MLKVKNLNLTRKGKVILKNINFELKKNQHLAIIGANGAGKSFLSRVLAADLVANYGSEVEILNSKIGKVNLSQLRRKIGFVSSTQASEFKQKVSYIKNSLQETDPDLFTNKDLQELNENDANSILEVVLTGFFGSFGLPEKPTDFMIQKAKQELAKFGFKANTKINLKTNFETLSDGEKRKVLLARSLVLDPQILILDEPCQGLDIPTREAFLSKIEEVIQDKLLIYTTHHLSEIPKSVQKILLLKNGEVFKFGDKKDILTTQNLTQLFEVDIKVFEKNDRYFEYH
jgi:iron complex transport system ATP-binding protein